MIESLKELESKDPRPAFDHGPPPQQQSEVLTVNIQSDVPLNVTVEPQLDIVGQLNVCKWFIKKVGGLSQAKALINFIENYEPSKLSKSISS